MSVCVFVTNISGLWPFHPFVPSFVSSFIHPTFSSRKKKMMEEEEEDESGSSKLKISNKKRRKQVINK
jgi:hypothetical protein